MTPPQPKFQKDGKICAKEFKAYHSAKMKELVALQKQVSIARIALLKVCVCKHGICDKDKCLACCALREMGGVV
jgi:hypothetical protein